MIDINRILCPVDFSPFSEQALRYAMTLAARYRARLQVAHVMPLLPPSSVNALAAASRRLSKKNLTALIDRCRAAGTDVSAALIESAEPAARILELAESFDADLIVTGSHGRTGYRRVLLGSVVETLLHRSPRPMLTIPSHLDAPAETAASFSRIVCAVDFAHASLNALAQALAIAEEADAQLTALHVIEIPPELQHPPQPPNYDVAGIRAEAEAACRARLQALIPKPARDYCTIDVAVLEGGVSRQILRLAADRQADLIVLGVHGRNVFDLAFFGSTSKDIIRHAHCPVLTVPVTRRLGSLKTAS
jgi:nucleotide-binding universal stress UspA family protein